MPICFTMSNTTVTEIESKDSKPPKVQRGPSRRCRHWARGMCKRGEACSFLHTGAAGVHVPCRHFVRTGSCRRGNLCDFKHDARLAYDYHDARTRMMWPDPASYAPFPPASHPPLGSFLPLYHPLPSPSSFYAPPQPPTDPLRLYRSPTPCRHWQNGLCRLGKSCAFAHDGAVPQKFRTTPCRHWLKGACRLGEACGFAHPAEVG